MNTTEIARRDLGTENWDLECELDELFEKLRAKRLEEISSELESNALQVSFPNNQAVADLTREAPASDAQHMQCNEMGERRAFAVHPSIIRSLIHEQSSSYPKALAELVMNSIDAGATEVRVEIDKDGFIIADDGKGFNSRNEVEALFEVFGAPHKDGDATYGRFRVGRGQIMAHAATSWRSGHFEMQVDIERQVGGLHYVLSTHQQVHQGCEVRGTCYKKYTAEYLENEWGDPIRTDFARLIRYMTIPVYLNGVRVSADPRRESWDLEDEWAWYRFDKDGYAMSVYDRGLAVCKVDPKEFFGRGGVVVSKQPLQLNMARNEINYRCKVWHQITRAALRAFDLRLVAGKRLSHSEARALVAGLLSDTLVLSNESRAAILRLKFIEDTSGALQSPQKMLGGSENCNMSFTFCCYDRAHAMVAERVQREGLASVLPEWIFACGHNGASDNVLHLEIINRLRKVLRFVGVAKWVPLASFAESLRSTHTILKEEDLSEDEELALKVIRKVNRELDVKMVRKILVGQSDHAYAWTDGVSYIVLSQDSLGWLRNAGGSGRIIALLAHEYSHKNPSLESHAHDLEFYQRFHTWMHGDFMHSLGERLMRAYARGVAQKQIQPSWPLRYHVDQMAALSHKLKKKRGSD